MPSDVPSSADVHTSLDVLTLSAAAVTAYLIANVLHEGLGHGGACLLTGCDPQIWTTAYFGGEMTGLSDGAVRFIAAAGTLVNLVAGVLFFGLLRRARHASGTVRYFLWCSMTVNVLVATGYLLFSGVLGVGDWMDVVRGWNSVAMWRVGLAVAGFLLYRAAARFSLRELARLTGSGDRAAVGRVRELTLRPYLLGSALSTIGALLNPMGMIFAATSAAAHFGGTSALARMARRIDATGLPPVEGEPIQIRRSAGWVTVATTLLTLHIAILGPGIRF